MSERGKKAFALKPRKGNKVSKGSLRAKRAEELKLWTAARNLIRQNFLQSKSEKFDQPESSTTPVIKTEPELQLSPRLDLQIKTEENDLHSGIDEQINNEEPQQLTSVLDIEINTGEHDKEVSTSKSDTENVMTLSKSLEDKEVLTLKSEPESFTTLSKPSEDEDVSTSKSDTESVITLSKPPEDKEVSTLKSDTESVITLSKPSEDEDVSTSKSDTESVITLSKPPEDKEVSTLKSDIERVITLPKPAEDEEVSTSKSDIVNVITLPKAAEETMNLDADASKIIGEKSTKDDSSEIELHPYHYLVDAIPPVTNLEPEEISPPKPLGESEFEIVNTRDGVVAMMKTLRMQKEIALDVTTKKVHSYDDMRPAIIAISTDYKDYLIDLLTVKEFALAMLPEVLINPKILKVFFHYRTNAQALGMLNLFAVNIFEVDTNNTMSTWNFKRTAFKKFLTEQYQLDTSLLFIKDLQPFEPERLNTMRMRTHFTLHMYRGVRNKILNDSPDSYLQMMEGFKEMNRKFDPGQKQAEFLQLQREIELYRHAQDTFLKWIYEWRDKKCRELDQAPSALLPIGKLKEIVLNCAKPNQVLETLMANKQQAPMIASAVHDAREEIFQNVMPVNVFGGGLQRKQKNNPNKNNPNKNNPNKNNPNKYKVPMKKMQTRQSTGSLPPYKKPNKHKLYNSLVMGQQPQPYALPLMSPNNEIRPPGNPYPWMQPNFPMFNRFPGPNKTQQPIWRAPVLRQPVPMPKDVDYRQMEVQNSPNLPGNNRNMPQRPNKTAPHSFGGGVKSESPLPKRRRSRSRSRGRKSRSPPRSRRGSRSRSKSRRSRSRSRSRSGRRSSSRSSKWSDRSRHSNESRTPNDTRRWSRPVKPPPPPHISHSVASNSITFCDDEDNEGQDVHDVVDKRISKFRNNFKRFNRNS